MSGATTIECPVCHQVYVALKTPPDLTEALGVHLEIEHSATHGSTDPRCVWCEPKQERTIDRTDPDEVQNHAYDCQPLGPHQCDCGTWERLSPRGGHL